MPRGKVTKVDIEAKLYKLKNSSYDGKYQNKNSDWNDGYHHALNKVLDILKEYRI